MNTSRFFETVDAADVGVVQRGQDLCLTLKAGEAFGIVGERLRQDFDRDVAVQLRIARPIHFSHPAGPQGGEDLYGPRRAPGVRAKGSL